ncbi:MAG: hypothetical protein OWU84_01010 [Firmicutes bacterium]|nr:hypothetical protein [Bacillota bacterium]
MATVEIEEETIRELTSLLLALKDSVTPGLAGRITDLLAGLGAVAAEVEPETGRRLVARVMEEAPALEKTVTQLADWHRHGVWEALVDTASLAAAVKDGLTPSIVERLAGLAAALGTVAGSVGPGVGETVSAVEQHGQALAQVVHEVARWQADGTWDALVQVVSLVKALTDSVTPEMLERTLSIVIEGVSALQDAFDSGLLTVGVKMAHALHQAAKTAEGDTGRISATALMRRLREPGVQRGMKVLMALVQELPQVVNE